MDVLIDIENNTLIRKILKDFPPCVNIVSITDSNALPIANESLNLYVDKSLDQDQYSNIILGAVLNNGKWITLDGSNYIIYPMHLSR